MWKFISRMIVTGALVFGGLSGFGATRADDWPMLGRDGSRNGVSSERGAPTDWSIEEREGERLIQVARGVRWSARLGSMTSSSPVESGGLVWIGTNNWRPDMQTGEKQHSVLRCFRVNDGQQVFEYVSPHLPHRDQDPGWLGLGSSPLIEGDRLWLVTNRAEVVCLDIAPLRRGEGPPRELWKLDLIAKFAPFQRMPSMGPARPCSIGASWNGLLFVTINNGVEILNDSVPKPDAPSLVCLNKETGELLWKDNSPGENILLTQFASPTLAEIAGKMQVIVPQSDGWVRAFDPASGEKLWEFDVNLKAGVYLPHLGRSSRNSLVGNAVVVDGRVYLASGGDAEEGAGTGRLVCIDPTKRGDVSSELAVDANDQPLPRRRVQAVDLKAGEKAIPNPNSALVWDFLQCGKAYEQVMHRTMSSVAIAKGLVIVPDIDGAVHCLDAKTGKHHWGIDVLSGTWCSPLIVEDKVYVANEDGDVVIFRLTSEPHEPLARIAMGSGIYSSPVFANGTLYVASQHQLFAITGDKEAEANVPNVAGHWTQWRGPNRDNISTATELMKEWPASGPPLRWRVQGLGEGISPVSIAGGRVFALSQFETTDYIRAVNERTGQPLWTAAIGSSLRQSPLMRWLTQRPPTVDGERLYAISLLGELACLRTADGTELWRQHYATAFGGQRGVFGFSDCPLVEDDKLICTPAGVEASIIALDKKTGRLLWKCAVSDAGRAAYGNGVVTTIDGQRQFITFLEKTLVGVAV